IQRKSAANHVHHHRNGGADGGLVLLHSVGERSTSSTVAAPAQHHISQGRAWRGARLVTQYFPSLHGRTDRNPDWTRTFGAGYERRRNHGAGVPRNRAPETAKP